MSENKEKNQMIDKNNKNSIEDFFNSLFITDEEKKDAEEVKKLAFYSDGSIDDAIEKYKELEEQQERFKSIYKEKKDNLDLKLNSQISKLEKQKKWIAFNLKQAVMSDKNKKKTKTQYSLKFLSGTVQIKIPQETLIKPDLNEDLLKTFPSFIEEQTVKTLNWKNLKTKLEIIDGRVYNKETGEDVTGKIEIQKSQEKVVIK
ncbi:hypothetical protein BJV85_002786 [Clostridium acetobutylicum]|uniref:Uncharacterized protein n=1 Tax=Clostridium acetobutylicum (strain ATCC 824 / DSM 792 / JCM 1419 / IAM 19013 / LMG 5710 / NBRC 13948 / NRRL B-527 / VKM B-1787 / 2291 / W) TaxID=272562 RepID=Q97JR1_CLOAB|nr:MULTISPECIES: host-nuclease inhibitor Gam family protein [Clostridium]AAK79184.1 Hypothetical protein CA_C1212 [Clostridium acetobutylicum ATCC 824]ADZ20262.1 Conserved hypothetical protein [Clostridium acetobutylicum EA 2018]AEI31714.1 hypothetical protein SMB_G1232 [Clostridium acetobutylicum DSM 1731]AWV81565.1 hypothetical protein DK921_15990 [Clostridium acetobutylicum]MBC2393205.1 hypothetical protein [Clostridium acetobutylicum]